MKMTAPPQGRTSGYGFFMHQYTLTTDGYVPIPGCTDCSLSLRAFYKKNIEAILASDGPILPGTPAEGDPVTPNFFFGQAGGKAAPQAGLFQSYTFWSHAVAVLTTRTVRGMTFRGLDFPGFIIPDPDQLVESLAGHCEAADVFPPPPAPMSPPCTRECPTKCLCPAIRCMYPYDAASNAWCPGEGSDNDYTSSCACGKCKCKWCPDLPVEGKEGSVMHPSATFAEMLEQITKFSQAGTVENNETELTEYAPEAWEGISPSLGEVAKAVATKAKYPVLAFGIIAGASGDGHAHILWVLLLWVAFNMHRSGTYVIPLVSIDGSTLDKPAADVMINGRLFSRYSGPAPGNPDPATWNKDLVDWVEARGDGDSGWLKTEYDKWGLNPAGF